MDYRAAIQKLARQPISHQMLMSLLRDYDRPNAKIHALTKEQVLQPVKKGLYIAGPALNINQKPEPFLLANHILGPSYVSAESALAYYGIIPERVYEIVSMTTKTPRKFKTKTGTFTYTRLPLPYYSFGILSTKLSDDQYAMIASAETALFDKILTTSGLFIRSKKSAREFLTDNMRMDEDMLRQLNTKEMSQWVKSSPKAESLSFIVDTIKEL